MSAPSSFVGSLAFVARRHDHRVGIGIVAQQDDHLVAARGGIDDLGGSGDRRGRPDAQVVGEDSPGETAGLLKLYRSPRKVLGVHAVPQGDCSTHLFALKQTQPIKKNGMP